MVEKSGEIIMATYDIDKITLPNGDVCNLYATNADENENLFVNGGPEIPLDRNSNALSPYNWTYSAGGGILSPENITFNPFEIKLTFTGPYSGTNAGINRNICRSNDSNNFNGITFGILVTELHDGDDVTLSLEYKSAVAVSYYPMFFLQSTSDSSTRLNVFSSTPLELPATNTWTKVSYTGVIPSGWEADLDLLVTGALYRGTLALMINPAAAGDFYIRKVKLNKGKVATEYTTDPLTQSGRFGSVSTYFASREATLLTNIGNQYGVTANNRIFPVVGVKTPNGFWVEGSCADKYQFAYSTNSGYTSGQDYGEVYSLPVPNTSASNLSRYQILTTKTTTEQLDIPLQTSSSTSSTGPGLSFYDEDGSLGGRILMTTGTQSGTQRIRRLRVAQYSINTDGTRNSYVERYTLPDVTSNRTADADFSILTTKDSISQIYSTGFDTGTYRTVSVSNSSRGLIVTGGTNASSRGMFFFNCTSTGTITYTTFFAASGISIDTATTRQIKFGNTSGAYTTLTIFLAAGSATTV